MEIISRVIERCVEDNVLLRPTEQMFVEHCLAVPMCATAAGPCRIQVCAVLGSSGIKLSE
jgi:hypothetical protein